MLYFIFYNFSNGFFINDDMKFIFINFQIKYTKLSNSINYLHLNKISILNEENYLLLFSYCSIFLFTFPNMLSSAFTNLKSFILKFNNDILLNYLHLFLTSKY